MKNLRKLREAHGMSQQNLADKLFVTQQSIYKYENDLAYPTLDTLKMMSKIFSVSIDFIVDNEHNGVHSDNIFILNSEERQLLANYRNLTPELKKDILQIVKHLH